MKRQIVVVVTALSLPLWFNSAYATHPVTFIGPSAKALYADNVGDYTYYSLAGEAGARNYRLDGTLGWNLQEDLRLKFSAEYLWQKLMYSFTRGTTLQMSSQVAVGGRLEYDYFVYDEMPTVSLTGYFSDTPGKAIALGFGNLVASQSYGLAPGVTIQPWKGSKFGAELFYDIVRYETISDDVHGVGVGGRFNQALMVDLDLDISASVRQPYNVYQANLNWTNDQSYGEWIVGLGAGYTIGKSGLPSSYNIAVNVNFLADWGQPATSAKKHANVKDDYRTSQPDQIGLKQWASESAVYMPEVLTVADSSAPTPA
jgi:hypothetical protein